MDGKQAGGGGGNVKEGGSVRGSGIIEISGGGGGGGGGGVGAHGEVIHPKQQGNSVSTVASVHLVPQLSHEPLLVVAL